MKATRAKSAVREASAAPPRRTPAFVTFFRTLLYFLLFALGVFGSPLIQVGAVAALVLAVLGDCDGGLRHVLRLVALSLAIEIALVIGIPAGAQIAGRFAVPPVVGRVVGAALLGLLVIAFFGIFARALKAALRKRPNLNGLDHLLGLMLGGAEGVLVVASVCWVLGVFESPIDSLRVRLAEQHNATGSWVFETMAEARGAVRREPAGRWLMEVNPLLSVPAIQTLQMLAEAGSRPNEVLAAIDSGRLANLADAPVIRKYVDAVQSDPALREAFERHDVPTILRSPQVQAMLYDQELHQFLLAHRDELRQAVE